MVSIIIPISAITIKIVSMIPARWPGVLNTTVLQYDSVFFSRSFRYLHQ